MILKHYACCSDKRLLEQLNANIDYQFFCDINIGHHRLTNYKIISQIRCELASRIHIAETEKVLFNHWYLYIKNQDSVTTDATCYESEVRYPTNQKLLWESVYLSYGQMKIICKELKPKQKPQKYFGSSSEYIRLIALKSTDEFKNRL